MKNKRFLSCMLAIPMFLECFCPKVNCRPLNENNKVFNLQTVIAAASGVALGAVVSGGAVLALLCSGNSRDPYANIDYRQLIRSLDENLLWKMVIDGRYHSKGPDICDKGGRINGSLKADAEPGYLYAMLTAFKYMVSTIGKDKLDVNLFREFHKQCLTGVTISSKRDRLNYRSDPGVNCFFGVVDTNSNRNGKNELLKKKASGWACERMLNAEIKENDGVKLYGNKFNSVEEAECFVKTVFDTYYSKLDELNSSGNVSGSWLSGNSTQEDKKLEIIIRICQCLDQAHTFYDGNIRTIVFLVMNKMLVENGLSPVCMWNPNCLDLMDVSTLIGKVKEGQTAFKKIFLK